MLLGSPDCSPVRKKSTMEDLFGGVFVTKVEPAKQIVIRAEEEVNWYRDESCLPLDSDPLLWWSQHGEVSSPGKACQNYAVHSGNFSSQ